MDERGSGCCLVLPDRRGKPVAGNGTERIRLRARTGRSGTVAAMTWLVSAPYEGSFMLVRLPEGAAVHVRFSDTGEVRDITEWMPDLMLIGLVTRVSRGELADTMATDQVTVAEMTLVGADDLEALFVNPGTNQTDSLHWAAAAELATVGIAEQLTAAVAHDLVEGADPALLHVEPTAATATTTGSTNTGHAASAGDAASTVEAAYSQDAGHHAPQE